MILSVRRHHGRMGIELGTIDILVHAHIVEGVKFIFDDKGQGTLSYLVSYLFF